MLSPAELQDALRRTADGDRAAFESLYLATSAKLLGVVLRIVRRRDVAEDVVQDVYVTIWQRAAEFDPHRGGAITWMATIARNRAFDLVRRRGAVALEDTPEALDYASDTPDAFRAVAGKQALGRLARCLEDLMAERREAVLLAYRDGWSREELSRRYGAPVATIKTWLHRSLKQLKECMGE